MSNLHLPSSRILFLPPLMALMIHCGGGGGGGGGPIEPPPPPPGTLAVTTGTAPPPRFIPASGSVAAGGTVTWTNASPVVHDLLATTGNWHLSRTLAPGESFQTTIAQAGTYRYQCTIHAGMIGNIEVR